MYSSIQLLRFADVNLLALWLHFSQIWATVPLRPRSRPPGFEISREPSPAGYSAPWPPLVLNFFAIFGSGLDASFVSLEFESIKRKDSDIFSHPRSPSLLPMAQTKQQKLHGMDHTTLLVRLGSGLVYYAGQWQPRSRTAGISARGNP